MLSDPRWRAVPLSSASRTYSAGSLSTGRTQAGPSAREGVAPGRLVSQQIVGERRAGAPLRFVTAGGDGFDGQMLVFDPPSVMEFTRGPDLLRIELEADGDGTLLTLTGTFDDLGKAARDAAGWHECRQRPRWHAPVGVGRDLAPGAPGLRDRVRTRRRHHRPAPRLGRPRRQPGLTPIQQHLPR
jgi:hypothetical protein